MDGSIGAMLGSWATSPMPSPRSTTGMPSLEAPTESFASQLDAGFRARAAQLGLQLPAAPPTDVPASDADGVDAIWQRAQVKALADGFGPGDAMMRQLADAADARWQQRAHGASNDYFG